MGARGIRSVVAGVVGVALVAVLAPGGVAVAAPKVDACSALTTDELGAALDSVFQPGSAYNAGTGTSCGFDGIGPVRGATA